MGMTFPERVAAVSLGLIPGDQRSEVATSGLVEGYDSRSLAALAGQSANAYDAWQSDRLWVAALDELGLGIPDRLDAAKSLVRAYARLVTVGEISPRTGAANIVEVHRAVEHPGCDEGFVGACIDAARIVGLHFSHDDCGFLDHVEHERIDLEIVEECRRLADGPAV